MEVNNETCISRDQIPDEILSLGIGESRLRDQEFTHAACMPLSAEGLTGFINVWKIREAEARDVYHSRELQTKAAGVLAYVAEHANEKLSMWMVSDLKFVCLHGIESRTAHKI
jgi:hypothetical protein